MKRDEPVAHSSSWPTALIYHAESTDDFDAMLMALAMMRHTSARHR